ncbi:MAG: CBS domain-containing protein [Chloroflexi bacterium]|nr:CBS domain-containing protein [Chloroflexota bacterium]
MTQLLIVILDDLACMPDLLQAWQAIGVPGTTILESVGAYRVSTWLSRVGLGALDGLFEAKEVRRRTLLAAIEDDDLLAQAVAEAERIVGGFDRPDSGLLLVLPVAQARGLHKVRPAPSQEELPPAVRPDWKLLRDTPVEEVAAILDLEPTIVSPDTPLDEVARAMLAHPNVHVACVVAEDGRLVGVLSLRSLADDFFFHILPEEFMSEVTDLKQAMQFAEKSRMRTAADAMQEPVWVKRGEKVKDAFKRMHEHDLSGVPVVDERYHIVGYINLLELLAICLERGEEAENGEKESP